MSEVRAAVIADDNNNGKELPAGWTAARLGDFLPLVYGKALPARSRKESGEYPVFGSSGIVGSHDEHIAPENSIIVGRKGTAGAAYFAEKASWPIDTAYFAIPPYGFEPRYWYFQLYALQLGRLDQSTAIPSLSRGNYNRLVVRIPPSAEQKRIVSKIDELFSDIEAGEQALKRARVTLARYRKSVLKDAVTGELTADWREANKDKLEPADKLFSRILDARRAAWEKAELVKLKAKGKKPQGDAWKKKYKEPTSSTSITDAEQPNGWVWATVDQIAVEKLIGIDRGRQHQSDDVSKTPYVKMNNVTPNGSFDLSGIVYVDIDENEFEKFALQRGDLLFNTRNSFELVGKTALVSELSRPHVFNNNLMRIRLVDCVVPKFAWICFNESRFKRDLDRRKRSTTNVSALYASDLETVAFPVPTVAEQAEIVSLVEEALSKADHVEAALDDQERAARALKQSILKAAFGGRLVPQDPTDEPAAKLLERIKQRKPATQDAALKKVKRKRS